MAEKWRPVIGFEGRYEVSDMGRVRALTRGNQWGSVKLDKPALRKPHKDRDGYRRLTLGRAEATVFVHHLVLEAFVGPKPSEKHEASHKNRVRDDDRASNLEWATDEANCLKRDLVKHGAHRLRSMQEDPASKLRPPCDCHHLGHCIFHKPDAHRTDLDGKRLWRELMPGESRKVAPGDLCEGYRGTALAIARAIDPAEAIAYAQSKLLKRCKAESIMWRLKNPQPVRSTEDEDNGK